jgi:hypothetical protein
VDGWGYVTIFLRFRLFSENAKVAVCGGGG